MKQIRLSQGLYTLVNDEHYDFLMQWNWYASFESRGTKWYAVRREQGVKIRMHREVITFEKIVIPPGFVVDHANHNSLDNRFYDEETGAIQLEVLTQYENMQRSPGWKKKGQIYAPYKEKSNPPLSGGECLDQSPAHVPSLADNA